MAMKDWIGSAALGAMAGAAASVPTGGTTAIPFAIAGSIIGAVLKSKAFNFLAIVLIAIFLLGGAALVGIPWWVWAVIVLIIVFMLTKKK